MFRFLLPSLLACALAGCPATVPPSGVVPSAVPSRMPAASGSPAAPATGAPPWGVPADPDQRAKAANLVVTAFEMTDYHIHAHLDVFHNGQAVVVPALIGIDPKGNFISPLHTHQASGVLHVEAPAKQTITLGQFFTEWNVSLAGATAYVGGKPVADPAGVVLTDLAEIVVVLGPPPATIPASYQGPWS